jgi:hypothetical protein
LQFRQDDAVIVQFPSIETGRDMNEPQTRDASNEAASPPSELNLGRVVGTVVSVMVVIGLGFLGYEYWSNRELTYVKVTGRVMWDGKPVTIGAVMTQHTKYPREAAIGGLGPDGRFELISNTTAGAALGTHKIIVASYGAGMGTTPLVPREYLKAETTPLSIEVTSDPAKNHFELEVKGVKPETGPPAGRGPRPAAEAETEAEAEAAPSSGSETPAVEPAAVEPAAVEPAAVEPAAVEPANGAPAQP